MKQTNQLRGESQHYKPWFFYAKTKSIWKLYKKELQSHDALWIIDYDLKMLFNEVQRIDIDIGIELLYE